MLSLNLRRKSYPLTNWKKFTQRFFSRMPMSGDLSASMSVAGALWMYLLYFFDLIPLHHARVARQGMGQSYNTAMNSDDETRN